MSEEEKNAEASEAAEENSSTLTDVEADVDAKLAKLRDESGESNDDDSKVVDGEETVTLETTDVEDEKPKEGEEESVMLPAGHRRAALARGYTNEQVDYYLETKPDEAVARFDELFNEWQGENSLWSDRGRKLRDAEAGATKVASEVIADVKALTESEPLAPFDAEKLKEAHPGSEGLIDDLVVHLNAGVERVNAVAEKLAHSEEFLQNTKRDALATVTQEFFTSKEMASFKDHYGLEIATLTEEQTKGRMELFGQADIIMAGAADHGIDITVSDALERAHIIVSQGTRDTAIQQEIRDSMEKRTKTSRSSHQKTTTPGDDEPLSDEEFEKRTDDRMKILRNK